MNQDIIKGQWTQVKGEVQRRWGKLTNDELDVIEGNRKKLSGSIQKAYGVAADEADKQVREWEKTRH